MTMRAMYSGRPVVSQAHWNNVHALSHELGHNGMGPAHLNVPSNPNPAAPTGPPLQPIMAESLLPGQRLPYASKAQAKAMANP